jgi:asparagine synthase (glutamine-hydrolysing)
MCGISAFLELSLSRSIACISQRKKVEEELEESLDIVAHRGPDARGRWLSNGHRVGEFIYTKLRLTPKLTYLS